MRAKPLSICDSPLEALRSAGGRLEGLGSHGEVPSQLSTCDLLSQAHGLDASKPVRSGSVVQAPRRTPGFLDRQPGAQLMISRSKNLEAVRRPHSEG